MVPNRWRKRGSMSVIKKYHQSHIVADADLFDNRQRFCLYLTKFIKVTEFPSEICYFEHTGHYSGYLMFIKWPSLILGKESNKHKLDDPDIHRRCGLSTGNCIPAGITSQKTAV